ncbi:C3HC zinc finger-like-domain-containing protein [Xylariaceae sp. FL0804]|nr:C3HC zinc finger-like-domain-containing protein [Xylariaceae sp. FL0804]
MNTTKRKFNALLQGIGSRPAQQQTESTRNDTLPSFSFPPNRPSSSTSVPESTAPKDMSASGASPTADLFGKRRRMGALESTSPNQKNIGANTSVGASKRWAPSSSSNTALRRDVKREPPKYSPGDRDELIRRLGTFQELTEWTPKPDKINEIEWARRGWVCQGKERVRCELCHKELVVKANKRTVEDKEVLKTAGSGVEEALVNKFAELIVEAHQEDCPWRRHGCHDTLLRLSLASPQTALASLRERYDDLCTRPSFMPYLFNLRLPEKLDVKATEAQLTSTFFTDPAPPATNPENPNEVALALALTGWQGLTNPRIGAVPNSATCATCLRRLGLWMFKSKEVDESTGQILVPAPMDHLDPVREHRFFCPWRSAAAQHNPGSKGQNPKAAWEVLALTVKNNAYLRRQAERSSQRTTTLHRPTASVPITPSKGGGSGGGADGDARLLMLGPDMVEDEEEESSARDAKDKERWARLRRVKSLFDTKNGKKLRRTLSRPGTATSRPPTAHSNSTHGAAADGHSAGKE